MFSERAPVYDAEVVEVVEGLEHVAQDVGDGELGETLAEVRLQQIPARTCNDHHELNKAHAPTSTRLRTYTCWTQIQGHMTPGARQECNGSTDGLADSV